MKIGTVLAVAAGLMAVPQQAGAAILINEVLADPPALIGDANGDGVVSATQDEFVELVNTDYAPVNLAGWSVSDSVKVRHLFGSSTIPARGFFTVFGGGSVSGVPHAATASGGGLGLNNDVDTVLLRDVSGILIDSLAYGSEAGRDTSLTRDPDAEGLFILHASLNGAPFSPGTTVDGQDTLAMPLPEPTPEPGPEPSPPSPGTVPEPPPSSLLISGLMMLRMMQGYLGRGRREQ